MDLYQRLGVQRGASEAEIENIFGDIELTRLAYSIFSDD